jgi:hypothetical protein
MAIVLSDSESSFEAPIKLEEELEGNDDKRTPQSNLGSATAAYHCC